MWWDVADTRVRRGTSSADRALSNLEGDGDVDTFLASVEVEAGNGVATTPADDDVETGVETTTGVETGIRDDEDAIA
jgi:hypothetical protein